MMTLGPTIVLAATAVFMVYVTGLLISITLKDKEIKRQIRKEKQKAENKIGKL